MVFSSLIFVFGLFPVCIIVGFFTRNKVKLQNIFLLLISFVFYSWGEPKYIYLFLFTIISNWTLVYLSSFAKKKWIKKFIGIAAISVDILILFWFKYSGWIFAELNKLFGLSLHVPATILPIGISFYTFQAISYVADVTLMGKYPAVKDPVKVGLYIAFFPQLIAGPIVRYEDLATKLESRRMSWEEFSQGTLRFLYGFCKKILLADSVAVITDKAFILLEANELSMCFAWLGAIAFTLQIFLDFSAYSDMAIGLGHMFGFTIRENFNLPYKAKTVRDFWRRWHMSLSFWFRDYVYIPLGGNRIGQRRAYFNLAVVWLLTGMWHGANWTFIIWGSIYGLLVILERYFGLETWLEEGSRFKASAYRLFTMLAVVLLWVVFRAENIWQALRYIACMFSMENFSTGLALTILYLSEYKWALVLGLLISIHPELSQEKKKLVNNIGWPALMILFIVSVSYLVKGTFSPFLYFNF